MTLQDYEYYRTEKGVLYCGDCLEIMPLITEKVDLVLTDPPYGIGFSNEKTSMSAGLRKNGSQRKIKTWRNPKPKNYIDTGEWDNKIPDIDIFNIILNKCDNVIIWGGNYFTGYLKPVGGWFVWDKKVPISMSLSKCELAWTSIGNSIQIFRYLWAGYKKEKPENRVHVTQKPVSLFLWCINISKTSGLVLDPFLGSGTTAVACEKLNRRWVGIEISEKYCQIAKERIKAEAEQIKMFTGNEK